MKECMEGSGSNCFNYLLWLIRHDRLMTYNLRRLMTMIQDDLCLVYHSSPETTLHAVRDCSWAKAIWQNIVQATHWLNFFSLGLVEWVDWSLENDIGAWTGYFWDLIFCTTSAHMWEWRNKHVHQQKQLTPAQHVMYIRRNVEEIDTAIQRVHLSNHQSTLLGWTFPRSRWVKLNVDGASKENPRAARCGVTIGLSSSLVVELWALWKGLQLAWDLGFRHVEVESDSKMGLSLVNEACDTHAHFNIVWKIKELLGLNWDCTLNHYWRGGNYYADALANYNLGLPPDVTLLPDLPDEVKPLLGNDLMGLTH
ncbi:hypothetical protein ACH5RR_004656 [Cinchona calisaya]|uniref:RNase H type-1 domain-containing protein n=1 Tax=Cinchona calisaya TaxID=153742 RepID=A0ABD3AYK9_9GENT